jgi:hypothetical protein
MAMDAAAGSVLFGGVAYCWFTFIRGVSRRERAALKEHRRAVRARLAAVEAGEDNPTFLPDAIEQSIRDVVVLAGELWRSGESQELNDRPDGGLIRAWARSRQWLGQGLEVDGEPSIDFLGVVNRHDEEEDRVAVRVRLRIHCKYPKVGTLGPHHAHLDERWTFGHRGSRWTLLSVSGDPLAGPVLTAPLIPNPSFDTERLSEESLAELATEEKVSDDVVLSDLVSPDEPPAYALLDLAIVDSRFGPELIAAQLAHLLDVWEGAVDGPEGPLGELATDQARDTLLRPGPGTRLIIRDAILKSWDATKLNLTQHSPSIEAALEIEAVRYVVRNDGSPVAGNRTDPHPMSLRWVLELTDSARDPWRLAMSNNPAESIPG